VNRVPQPQGSRRRIAANSVWSLAGLIVPAIFGLAATPAIVHGFGDERFGILALAWIVVGYFSFFDLGLGRAITRRVAELLGSASRGDLQVVVWTGWGMMLALGLFGALFGLLLAPWFVRHAIHVTPGLRAETLESFVLLALSIPIVVFMTGPRGVLEAAQRFGLVNVVRIPSGILTFLVPLITLQYTPELPPAVLGLILVRVLGAIVYTVMAIHVLGGVTARPAFSRTAARDLLGFGAWMTVSNIIGPLMVSFDRFVIGGMISVAAVTYYVTPSEVASKVLFIPSALAGVLFPVFAAAQGGPREALASVFRAGIRGVVLLVVPVVFLLTCFAPEILHLWLGPPFAERSATVMQWLLIGMLLNSPGQLAFGLVQSAGRSDITAKLHAAELVPYVAILVPLLMVAGIQGAAIAWTLRVAVDTAFLLWFGARESRIPLRDLLPSPAVPGLLFAFCVAAALLPLSLEGRFGLTAVFSATFALAAWRWGGIGEIVRTRLGRPAELLPPRPVTGTGGPEA
jgi:O-antigen/teichoic acid export membrane protein